MLARVFEDTCARRLVTKWVMGGEWYQPFGFLSPLVGDISGAGVGDIVGIGVEDS